MLDPKEAYRLIRTIAELANGSFRHDESLNTIECAFPVVNEGAFATQATTLASMNRMRVLHVEDTERTGDLVYYYLRHSYDVDTAQNADEALRLAFLARYDYVLMDMHLGKGMDGFDLTRLLRASQAFSTVPIIAITAYTGKKEIERSLEVGCDAYLAKPFLKDDLLRLLRQFEVKKS